MDLRWKMVTCADCGHRYRCTPDTDYYRLPHEHGERTDTNGRCWRCHLYASGLDPDQPEPTLGLELDPWSS